MPRCPAKKSRRCRRCSREIATIEVDDDGTGDSGGPDIIDRSLLAAERIMPMKLFASPRAVSALLLLIAPAIPHAAEPVTDKARALHERIVVLDSHLDTPMMFDDPKWNILERHQPGDGTNQVDLPRMIEGGLDGGLWVIYTPQRGRSLQDNRVARDHGLKRLLQIHKLVAANPDKFELALTPDDARRIAAAGKRVVFISMENASPLTLDPSLLQFYFAQGLRVLGLVHTSNNEFADSSNAAAEWNGLSPRGRELIAEANRLGLVIDHSHASDAVFDQLLELSKSPIILTHTSSDALHDHMRNIDDGRLRKLAAHGGLIQVNGVGSYLKDIGATDAYRSELRALNARYSNTATGTPEYQQLAAQRQALEKRFGVSQATFEDYMRHVLHIISVAGPEHVGFGADWDGGGGVVGLEDVSMLPRITARLLDAGFTEAQIEAMWGGNLLRLLGEAQRVAAELAAATPAQG
jgi:membrane dipeptidase